MRACDGETAQFDQRVAVFTGRQHVQAGNGAFGVVAGELRGVLQRASGIHGGADAFQVFDTAFLNGAAYQGSLFFGAANKLDVLFSVQAGHPDVVVLDFERVVNVDTSALDILTSFQRDLSHRGTALVLCNLAPQPASIFRRSGFSTHVGDANICNSLSSALQRADEINPGGNVS